MSEDRRRRYEALVREVVVPLRRFAARRTDSATADDVVADALLVLWRRLDEVPVGGELPWCYAVARGCLRNAERSARRHLRLVERVARLDPPLQVAAPEQSPADPALDRALAGLRAEDRELLRLWAWEDLEPREIATVLGITANAASIRLHRAKNRLAELLDVPGKTPRPTGHTSSEGTETRS